MNFSTISRICFVFVVNLILGPFILLKGISLLFNTNINLDTYIGTMLIYGTFRSWFYLGFIYKSKDDIE